MTSYAVHLPLVLAAYVAVSLLSKMRPLESTSQRYTYLEFLVSIGLTVSSTIGMWLMYVAIPISFWKLLPSPQMLFRLIGTTLLVTVPVALYLVLFRRRLESVRVTFAKSGFSLLLGISASAFMIVPTAVLAPMFIQKLFTITPIFLLTNTYTSFSEEFFFRGLVQTRMEGFLGLRKGLLLTALAFGLWHVPSFIVTYGETPMQALGSALLMLPEAILLGAIAQRSNNLLGPTIFHFSSNLPVLLLSPYASYY